jgi:NADH:ubiquinone oxidoreductase subunit 3 (subunit A)
MPEAMSNQIAVLWVLLGIIISLVLPLAVSTLKKASGLEGLDEKPTLGQRFKAAWIQYGGNKYLGILIAAIVVAVVIVFLLGLHFFTARDAAIAGFAWESFVKKLFTKQSG